MDYDVIRKELNEAIAAIGAKHGFTGSIGNISYNDAGFHTSVNCKVNDIGNGKSGAQLEYEMVARKFAVDPNTFGKVFTSQGKTFKVVGINPKARTMPIIAVEVGTETKYKFPTFGKGYNFLINAPTAPMVIHNFGEDK